MIPALTFADGWGGDKNSPKAEQEWWSMHLKGRVKALTRRDAYVASKVFN